MDDDSSSIELVYEDNLSPPKVKDEEIDDDEPIIAEAAMEEDEEEEEEECVVVEVNDNYSFNQDKDPMNLLEELTEKQSSEEEESEEKTETDNEGDVNETEAAKLRKLAEKYEWAFLEVGSPIFCLYCNADLKLSNTFSLPKHEHSSTHKHRKEAYLDFQNQLNKDVKRLFSNRDFDGVLKDAKQHRQELEEDFANYLWDKWEEQHDWIVRTDVCFIAYCKYCHIKINVANAYGRKQHEVGAKHKELRIKAPKRRNTVCADLPSLNSNESNEGNEENLHQTEGKRLDEWFEKSKSSSDLCRCKLCDITMFKCSYYRHVASNLHKQNISALDNPGVSDKLYKPDWEGIAKNHEWIMEDPKDPMEAFCKFCDKRLGYGSSAAKRLIHEHSSAHRAAERLYKNLDGTKETDIEMKKRKKIENNEDEDEHEADQETDKKAKVENGSESGETIESERGDDATSVSGKKRSRSSNGNKTERYSWAKVYKKDPKYISCQYCKVLLGRVSFNGRKHENTSRHKESELMHQEKINKKNQPKDVLKQQPQRSNEKFYPWLVKYRYGVDYVYCKYCDLIFSRKANRSYHQSTKRHQAAEKAVLAKEAEEENKTPVKAPKSASPSNPPRVRKSPKATRSDVRSMKVKILEWQKRFAWLRFKKGLLLNYAFCAYCNKSVFVPSPAYASKHQRSSPHTRARIGLRKQKQTDETANEERQSDEVTSEKSETSAATDLSKRSRASSLRNAIETAKRLTAAHLEMMSFMQNNGQKKSDFVEIVQPSPTTVQPNTQATPPLPPPSPSVDSNVTMPIISRDPFDLFFNSMSESIKRLPADLASEGKLKVMQIIFELEIRSQQRQNHNNTTQSEVMCTSSTPSLNGSILNTTIENELLRIPADSTAVKETLINIPVEPSQHQQQQQQHNQQQQHSTPPHTTQQHQPMHQQMQQQQQQQQQQQPHQHQPQAHQHQKPKRSQNTYNIQSATAPTSMLKQQLMQPQLPLQQQQKNQPHNFSTSSPSPASVAQRQQRSVLPKTPITMTGGNQSIHDNSPKPPYSVLTQQRLSTNKTAMGNINKRLSGNNTSSATYATTTPTSALSSSLSSSSSKRSLSNVGTFFTEPRGINNCSNPTTPISTNATMPSIRPVPISTLTITKYSSEEPQIHHIQLNSSTQSKIIPLETGMSAQR